MVVPLRHATEVSRAAGVSVLGALRDTAWPATFLAISACTVALAAIALYPHYAIRVFGL
jgi:hypothetical protein